MRPKPSSGPPRETWCIVVEGAKRERLYFEQLKPEFNRREFIEARQAYGVGRDALMRVLSVESVGGGSAHRILQAAIDRTAAFDRVACVLDGDNLAGAEAIVQDAILHGVMLFLSYPCFEVWILLHLQTACGEEVSCEPLKRLLLRLWPEYEKRPQQDWIKLKRMLPEAKVRAARLRLARAETVRGTTTVDELVEKLGF